LYLYLLFTVLKLASAGWNANQ